MFINREKDREIVAATKEGLMAAIKRKNLISRRMINLMKNKENLLALLLCFTLLITTAGCGVSSTVLKKDKKWWTNITDREDVTDISSSDDAFTKFFKDANNKDTVFALKNVQYFGCKEDIFNQLNYGFGEKIHLFVYKLSNNGFLFYAPVDENSGSVYINEEYLDIVAIYRDFTYEYDDTGDSIMTIRIDIIGIQDASDN